MILNHTEISRLLVTGVIKNGSIDAVNSSSLDIHLGNVILAEESVSQGPESIVYLRDRKPLHHDKIILGETGQYILAPGEFILAQSQELFYLPNNISAEYKLKSSMARIGLDHLNAGWCDAGWHGSVLTLELKNVTRNHKIVLTVGDRIGQMVFHNHAAVPDEYSYRTKGTYNGDTTVTGAKG